MQKIEVTEDEQVDLSKYNGTNYMQQTQCLRTVQSSNLAERKLTRPKHSMLHPSGKFNHTTAKKYNTVHEIDRKTFLKNLIKKQRIQNLVHNFCSKMKHNITARGVKVNLESSNNGNGFIYNCKTTEGFSLTNFQNCSLIFVSTLLSIILTIFYSLQLVFPELQTNSSMTMTGFEVASILIFALQIGLNFVSKHYKKGRSLLYIYDISLDYLKQSFFSDFIIIWIIIINLSSASEDLAMRLFRMLIFFKMINNLKRLDNLESILISTTRKQQYYRVCNIFLTNFFCAHMLSICLNAMAFLSQESNWLIVHGLNNSQWYIRYIWGVYWGTTIMLTVGFGDFSASNYKEALCLTLIQMISCIALSYNINCVGNFINNIRAKSFQKNQNLRTFSRMNSNSPTSPELESRINNYIEESFQIRKQFGLEEEDRLLEYIPRTLKKEYLKDVTCKIFGQTPFIRRLTEKTRYLLAESITRYVAYPQQIILRKGAEAQLLILQKGHLGFALKRPNCKINGQVIEKISVADSEPSKLITLDFLKGRSLTYDVKSLSYAILYTVVKDSFVGCLKQSKADFQLYCVMRDRTLYKLNDYQLYKCEICQNQYHTKFGCPSLHFIPFNEQVITKYIHRINFNKQGTRPFKRPKAKFDNAISLFSALQKTFYQGEQVSTKAFFRKRRNNILQNGKNIQKIQKSIESLQFIDSNTWKSQPDNQQTFHKEGTSYKSQQIPNPIDLVEAISQNTVYKLLELKHVQCDALFNWTYYFPQWNPVNLKKKHSK